jgi:hypothetical protein
VRSKIVCFEKPKPAAEFFNIALFLPSVRIGGLNEINENANTSLSAYLQSRHVFSIFHRDVRFTFLLRNVFTDVNPWLLTLRLNPMKNFLLMLFLLCATSAWAQNLPTTQTDGLVAYTGTVEMLDATKAELVERAKNWLMSSEHSISFISEEMGMISVGSAIPYEGGKLETKASVSGRVVYVATILVQDGFFVYEFNNFFHEANPNVSRSTDLGFVTTNSLDNKDLNRDWKIAAMDDVRGKLDISLQKTIENLKKTMQNENPSLSKNVKDK